MLWTNLLVEYFFKISNEQVDETHWTIKIHIPRVNTIETINEQIGYPQWTMSQYVHRYHTMVNFIKMYKISHLAYIYTIFVQYLLWCSSLWHYKLFTTVVIFVHNFYSTNPCKKYVDNLYLNNEKKKNLT